MTDAPTAADKAELRTTLAALDACIARRKALAVALAVSATAFHRAMKHGFSDWRGGCPEPECRAAWTALMTHGGA